MSQRPVSGSSRRFRRSLTIAFGLVAVLAACSGQGESISVGSEVVSDLPSGSEVESGSVEVSSQPTNEFGIQAAAFYDSQLLPADGLPPGFIEIDRLQGECVASFGVEVISPEAAYRSGVYWFEAGTQPERVDAAHAACRKGLLERGVLRVADQDAHETRYIALVEVHDCLSEHGYPTSTPPSKEAFVDSPNSWSPWEAMIGTVGHILEPDDIPTTGPLSSYFESLAVCPRP